MGYKKDKRSSPAPFRSWMRDLHEARVELTVSATPETIVRAAELSVEAWAAGQGPAGRRRIPRDTLREVYIETVKPAEQACDERALSPIVVDLSDLHAGNGEYETVS